MSEIRNNYYLCIDFMAKDFFRFKRFTISQSRCAMKVGTDGTLLGAWARGGQTILDVGTGTGLIALMMAQRFPEAEVTGIDIDEAACSQAEENVAASPFRVSVLHKNVLEMDGVFDAIVSNPPFFSHSLESPDRQRSIARHTSSLGFGELMQSVVRLLADDGELSLILPAESKSEVESEAALSGLFKVRECAVRTTPRKHPKRFLQAYRKHPAPCLEVSEGIIETEPGTRSEWYQDLTKEFYL